MSDNHQIVGVPCICAFGPPQFLPLPQMLNVLFAAVLILLSGCAGSATTNAAAGVLPIYKLVDLTDDFAEFQQTHADIPDAAKLVAFKSTFDALIPGFYDHRRIPWLSEAQYDQAILTALQEYPQSQDALESRAAAFANDFVPAFAQFQQAFPDLAPIGNIYVLYSLQELDGGVREFAGASHLVFGIDVMQLVHEFADETPFIHHELFHVFHGQFFEECNEIWCALWSEGLAVAAAKFLSREATDDQLLLTSPRPIRAAVDANLTEAVCVVRRVLHSFDDDDYAKLFAGSAISNTLPPRFAYYVGYLVAGKALREQSLEELAKMPAGDAESMVESSLAALATCPG